MKNNLKVKCRCCKGTGYIDLTGVYAETLKLLKTMTVPVNGAEMARMCGCKETAMCNRLRALERHGFAKSKQYGRQVHWSALAPATEKGQP